MAEARCEINKELAIICLPEVCPFIRDVTTLMSFKGKIRQLNISELLDDGCAGCSLCIPRLLYIFSSNPVIR